MRFLKAPKEVLKKCLLGKKISTYIIVEKVQLLGIYASDPELLKEVD